MRRSFLGRSGSPVGDPHAAARTAGMLAAGGGGISVALWLLDPAVTGHGTSRWFFLAVAGTNLVSGLLILRWPDRTPSFLPAAAPGIMCFSIAAPALVTHQTTAATQLFYFCWPVLYAAYYLRPRQSWIALVYSVASATAVTGVLLPAGAAFAQCAATTITLVLVALVVTRSRSREARALAELRREASSDGLTGLATVRVLTRAAHAAIAGDDGDVGLLLVDVDLFKAINDRHGHPVGDAALVHLAGVLGGCFPDDRSGCDVVARLGGDEIAVLLPGRCRAAAELIADELRLAVAERPLLMPGLALALSVSIGVASYPQDAHDFTSLYAAADRALYAAKRARRTPAADVA